MNVLIALVLFAACSLVAWWRVCVARALRRAGRWTYNDRNNLIREIGVCVVLGVVVPLRLLLG